LPVLTWVRLSAMSVLDLCMVLLLELLAWHPLPFGCALEGERRRALLTYR